ncbi:MAG: cation diffusion facilitator family transporter [Candidatus Methanomethylophilaceae archaeon]|jgi:cation diffusion facilitator family transporter|nr:cation diffusion facilitator family transporter [Candidatus Methanomethylophilaceae archaeon]
MSHTENSCSVAEDSYRFSRWILILGITLLAVKISAWYITSSVAIMTDALESIVNVTAGAVGLYALYLSSRPPDKAHPFGHGGAEAISSSIEGLMMCVAGAIMVMEAIRNIISPSSLNDLDIGLVLVIVAAVANYAAGRMAIAKGRKNRSQALVASGYHLCTDTYTSAGIIAGLSIILAANHLGYSVPWMDGAVAVIFALIVLYTGIRVVKASMDTIMSKADMEVLQKVVETLSEHRHDDWIDIHDIRVMKNGSTFHIDMHVTFPRDMTIEAQSREIDEVVEAINTKFNNTVDLMLMGDPCTYDFCVMCNRDCEKRESEFGGYVRWTVENQIPKCGGNER